jgi:hypothetical protein
VRTAALGMIMRTSFASIAAFATEGMSVGDLEAKICSDSEAGIVPLIAPSFWGGNSHLGHDTVVEQIRVWFSDSTCSRMG